MSLEIITAAAIAPVQHGFFTRKGGVSTDIYHGLNCGYGSADSARNVRHNRDLVAKSFAVDPTHLISVHQTHSTQVTTVRAPLSKPVQSDAMVTDQPGLALAILTADCQPVLFSDANAGVIGAAHSGWKGAVGGVIQSTITEMIKLGAARENITAAIGPCISQASYEVGPEFLNQFVAENTDFTRFFTNGTDDRYLFDLPSFCLHQLRSEDIAHAEWVGHCTYTDESRFYSYRRTTHRKESDYGRMISAIVL